MKTEAQKECPWLYKLVNEWTYDGDAPMEPGKPPEKFTGTESVGSLGGPRPRDEARCPVAAPLR